MIVSSCLTYLMPYACLLASCSMGIPYTLAPLLWPHVPLCFLFSASLLLLLLLSFVLSLCPLLSRVFSIEPWNSLSGYVHPGIACLAFWASDLVGAFWTSLSDYPPLLGAYPSMTFVKLIVIGHCCDCLGGWLNCLAFTHLLIVISKS